MTASEKISRLPGVSTLLLRTAQLYVRNIQLYLGYTAWLFVPLVITILAFVSTEAQVFEVIEFGSLVLHTLLLIWVCIVIILATKHVRGGSAVPLRKVSSTAWRIWTPFLLTVALVSLIETAGLLLLIIPGVLFFVWYEFAAFFVVLEDAPIVASLSASRELSRGRFLSVAWRLIGGACILGALYGGVFAIVVLAGYAGSDMPLIDYVLAPPSVPEEIIYRLIDILLFPLFFIYQTLLFLELKRAR